MLHRCVWRQQIQRLVLIKAFQEAAAKIQNAPGPNKKQVFIYMNWIRFYRRDMEIKP